MSTGMSATLWAGMRKLAVELGVSAGAARRIGDPYREHRQGLPFVV
jgi:hypothetical protein